MKRKLKTTAALIIASVFLAGLAIPSTSHAATFNRNRIINDVVFDNTSTMNAGSINNFLNGFPNSCISPNSGFRAIKPTGYDPSGGYQYGGFVTAGEVIHEAAQAYGLNPQVLLVTLQKEQSLVSGAANNYCNNGDHKYAAALGFGCPDSGGTYSYSNVNLYQRNGVTRTSIGSTCVNSAIKAGFTQQVIRAAWLLKFGQQRSMGRVNWAVIKGSWDNSDDPQSCYSGPMTQGTFQRCPSGSSNYYDGFHTIDGAAVHMDTGATASLYWYTPHFHGNENFFNIFNSWFGSPLVSNTPWQWSLVSQEAYADAGRTQIFNHYPNLQPGQTAYMRIKARNFGYRNWDQSFLRLGTSRVNDRSSPFTNESWLSASRIRMVEPTVLPGETATFEFSMTAPSTIGTYSEFFNLVAENQSWLNDLGINYRINVVTTQSPSNTDNVRLNSDQALLPGQFLLSPDRQTTFSLEPYGAAVARGSFLPVWSNNVSSQPKKLIMQGDGNLVEYGQNDQVLWASNTNGNPGAYLLAQTDGNVVIYSASNQPLWSTNSVFVPGGLNRVTETVFTAQAILPGQQLLTANGRYRAVFQGDGNFVIYSPTRAIWASGTENRGGARLVLQGDGNLVIYTIDGRPLWASGTNNRGANRMIMQADGNMVMYTGNERAVWSTNTINRP